MGIHGTGGQGSGATTTAGERVILRRVAQALSPAGPNACLSILIFHRVRSQPDALFPLEPDISRFAEVIAWVSRWFNVMPLDQAVSQLTRGTLPARAAAITFDDGYADNVSNALPILQRHGASATFFVATGFLDGGCMWNDALIETLRRSPKKELDLRDAGLGWFPIETWAQKRHAIDHLLGRIKYLAPDQRRQTVESVVDRAQGRLPGSLMMRSEQVRHMRNAGMQIGAHTCSHPILQQATDAQCWSEITTSKAVLESLLDEPVRLFAYPNGKPGADYTARHVAMVKEAGFAAALSTTPGVAWQMSDPYQLPRFAPWERTRTRFGLRMLSNLRTRVSTRPA